MKHIREKPEYNRNLNDILHNSKFRVFLREEKTNEKSPLDPKTPHQGCDILYTRAKNLKVGEVDQSSIQNRLNDRKYNRYLPSPTSIDFLTGDILHKKPIYVVPKGESHLFHGVQEYY